MSHADTHRCKLMARLAESFLHSLLAQVVVLKDKKGLDRRGILRL